MKNCQLLAGPKLVSSDSLNLVATLNSHGILWTTEDLKMRLIDAYKAEEVYEKIWKCSQLEIFTVQNVIKIRQFCDICCRRVVMVGGLFSWNNKNQRSNIWTKSHFNVCLLQGLYCFFPFSKINIILYVICQPTLTAKVWSSNSHWSAAQNVMFLTTKAVNLWDGYLHFLGRSAHVWHYQQGEMEIRLD